MKISSNFVLRKVYGKSILMPIQQNSFTNSPILLNSTAEIIIDLLASCKDADDLFYKACEKFKVEFTSKEGTMVHSFIDDLLQKRIIVPVYSYSE